MIEAPERTFGASPARRRAEFPGEASARQLRKVQLICLAICGLLGLALWANMPYLIVEHQRLETWQIAFLWIGDFTALLWFVRFAFVHAVLGRPLTDVLLSEGRKTRKVVVIASIGAMVLDLVFTVYLMVNERAGYQQGVVTQAEVFAIQVHKRELATGYDLDCRFKDELGIQHQAHLRVLAKRHEMPSGLPYPAARLLEGASDADHHIPIRYDPRLPERAWINGLGWEDENGLYWFSVGTLLLQGGLVLLFLLLLPRSPRDRTLPWWWDMYKAVPIAAEAFCMLAMGLIDRLADKLN
ncbi:MAG TPA: DUF3592 domain-containing protein [Candidatus Dormibacteraeota bacterium]|nr:DUF3592 domain-containing protein [Candidatus Dormibacteraeota bacterium]